MNSQNNGLDKKLSLILVYMKSSFGAEKASILVYLVDYFFIIWVTCLITYFYLKPSRKIYFS